MRGPDDRSRATKPANPVRPPWTRSNHLCSPRGRCPSATVTSWRSSDTSAMSDSPMRRLTSTWCTIVHATWQDQEPGLTILFVVSIPRTVRGRARVVAARLADEYPGSATDLCALEHEGP